MSYGKNNTGAVTIAIGLGIYKGSNLRLIYMPFGVSVGFGGMLYHNYSRNCKELVLPSILAPISRRGLLGLIGLEYDIELSLRNKLKPLTHKP